MRKLIIGLFICLSTTPSFCQKWEYRFYGALTNEDFRDFPLFNQPIDRSQIDYPLLNAAVFYVTNEARIEKGLAPLEFQHHLEILAWNHSKAMGEKDFFDHYNREDKNRREPSDRAVFAGIQNPKLAENVSSLGGYKFASYLALADRMVGGWLNSPPHRKTLYSKEAVQLGCGIYYYHGLWQKNKDVWKQGDGFWLGTQNYQLYEKVVSFDPSDPVPTQ